MTDRHRQYVGPPHFWHRYALNHREQYYYGIGGIYGPSTGPSSMYRSGDGALGCGRWNYYNSTTNSTRNTREGFIASDACPLSKLLILLGVMVLAARWLK